MTTSADDPMKPRLNFTPRALFRSVSIAEMVSIIDTGEVIGMGNTFNGFDRRRHVFFCDAISDRLIGQGEEIERSVVPAWMASDEQKAIQAAEQAQADYIAGLIPAAKKAVAAYRIKKPMAAAEVFPGEIDWSEFKDPNSQTFKKCLHLMAEKDAVRAKFREFATANTKAWDAHREKLKTLIREETVRREGAEFTSAIIETRPLSEGFHYSREFGSSGMGEQDEFGLASGQVKADDIVGVRLLRAGTVIWQGDLSAVQEKLVEAGLVARATAPAL